MEHLPSHRVLVADDDQDTADSLADLLTFEGYAVCAVYDGAQALATARTFQPHIVILDINMPVMDGFEAAAALRMEPHGDELILVAHTSLTEQDHLDRMKRVGFNHYINKPPAPGEMSQLVLDCVARLVESSSPPGLAVRPGLSRLQ